VIELEQSTRFKVLRRLGEGGMGVVYEVDDLERGERVALKTLKRPDPETMYRLKHEFRAMAELRHKNLLALGDLVVEGDACFLTMELVEGIDFLSYVWHTTAETVSMTGTLKFVSSVIPGVRMQPSRPLRASPQLDAERLRSALRQLAVGLSVLHAAGRVHRDVKPDNVLVTREGRVILLDFGLVADLDSTEVSHAEVMGTVEYMAPEQGLEDTVVTAASDAYALGVMLFQALTGQVPFSGSITQVLTEKLTVDSPRVSSLAPDAPQDLVDLCAALLAMEPQDRPSDDEIMRRVGVSASSSRLSRSFAVGTEMAGRGREMAILDTLLSHVLAGGPAAATLTGESGLGKTALVRAFLAKVRERSGHAVVLEGRCYAREAVPFKAMDSLIDHLSTRWMDLGDEGENLLPDEAALLPRLFPVLARVPWVAKAPAMEVVEDPQLLRTRAFAALRDVFRHFAARQPLVLVLDDLQWVDDNTLLLLSDLMRPPDPPALLLVLSCRPEGTERLRGLIAQMAVRSAHIELGPLGREDATQLASRLLSAPSPEVATQIAVEAGGNPFFVAELAEYVNVGGVSDVRGLHLDDVLGERFARLPERAQRLLEVLVVAGEPISRRAATTATTLEQVLVHEQVDTLRAERIVQATGEGATDRLELGQERLRSAITVRLSDDRRRRVHRALVSALQRWGEANDERLARHLLGAGDPARAGVHARQAAEQAAKAFDFDRAARLYEFALRVGSFTGDERQALGTLRAEALSYAGRPADAARAFGDAAVGADPVLAFELRRRAAEEYLHGGYMTEGWTAMQEVLAEQGLSLSRSTFVTVFRVLFFRALLFLRGFGFRERPVEAIAVADLVRFDTLWSVAFGIVTIDTLVGAEFQTRSLLAALRLGEPRRVARVLAMEGSYLARANDAVRARRACDLFRPLAERTGDALATIMGHLAQGSIAYYVTNQWRQTVTSMNVGEAEFRAARGGAGFEVDTCRMMAGWSRLYLGEVAELGRLVPQIVREAQRRADRCTEVSFRSRFIMVHLASDDSAAAKRDVDGAMAIWPSTGRFSPQEFYALHSRCELALYDGDPERAHEDLERHRGPLFWSLLLTITMVRLEIDFLEGRIALALAQRREGTARKNALRRAKKLVSSLAGSVPIGKPLALMIEAGRAHLLGDRQGAIEALREAIVLFEKHDSRLLMAVVQWRLGQTLCGQDGGQEGTALLEEAEAWMRGQTIANPARMVAMHFPGWPC
jgi:hypothetical protein